jgi:hypothetical protein
MFDSLKVPYVKASDYTNAEGKVDWDAVKRAQVRNGENCSKCGGLATIFPRGYPDKCHECKQLDSEEEVVHSDSIRCPHCRNVRRVDSEFFELFTEGEHLVSCYNCEKDFTIQTYISWSFTSPPIVLSKRDSEIFLEALEDDSGPNEALQNASQHYKELTK